MPDQPGHELRALESNLPKFDSKPAKQLKPLWRDAPFCDYSRLSGGFWQVQCVEKLQLFRGCG
ncbi:MAG: hypothetical protein JJU19_12605, partial [Pararhodobacter sp.]|nr:hypothetical protein [Pararhodobacter sp.]